MLIEKKKIDRRIKWADNDGGKLSVLRVGEKPADKLDTVKSSKDSAPHDASWSDRKQRDRLREKELLLNAR